MKEISQRRRATWSHTQLDTCLPSFPLGDLGRQVGEVGGVMSGDMEGVSLLFGEAGQGGGEALLINSKWKWSHQMAIQK